MPLNLIFITPGTYTIDDNGIPGDNISVIRDSNGVVIFTFGHPADALGFTVNTPGVNIIVNFTDSMNAANFTIGSLTDPAQTPDSIVINNIETSGTVTLVSNGTITEGGSDAASDIRAGALILSAVGGVGTALEAIETRTGLLEAETTTGGINLSNIGSVQIGGVTANVDGLDVATSGDIVLNNVGSIFLTEANSVTAGEVVHGGGTSGNVTLIANGANSDIIGNVNNGAVTVPRGSVVLTAGRDIQLGTIGADFNNDVITNGAVTFTAGRDILIDGFADIFADNFGLDTGSDLTFTAGRNIGVLNLAGTSASVTASGSGGGNAILTTGFGGSLTVNGPGSFALGSTSGDVIINTDRLLINSGSGISAPSGLVSLTTRTDGRAILLGSASDVAAALELSDAELNRIFAPEVVIGSNLGGPIQVIAAIAPISAGNADLLTLRSAGDVIFNGSVTVNNQLSVSAGDNFFQAAGTTITADQLTVLADTLGDDDNTGASLRFEGLVSAPLVTLATSVDADNLFGSNAGEIMFGSSSNDVMNGNGGNDELRAQGGNDTMDGGAGNDVMFGGPGNDIMEGGADNDLMQGGSEDDQMTGGAGIDSIFGTNGNDTLDGGIGDDDLHGQDGNDQMTGGDGNDDLFGGPGVDNMSGGNLNDELFGGSEADVLFGNDGNDELTGGLGSDLSIGGAGVDRFIFRAANESTTAAIDTVADLVTGEIIDLVTIDANSIAGGDQAFTFIGGAAFSNVAGQLRAAFVAGVQWSVQGDVNGDGVADFDLIVLVSDAHPLGAADFAL